MIIQNKGYAPGLALGRRIVSYVSHRWLRGFLLYENLLIILLDHLLVLLLFGDHEFEEIIDEYEEEVLEPTLTDSADTAPAQGKPRCITLILNNHYIYMVRVLVSVTG